ncbi:hypothetical protein YYC_05808 [Plasmodium yoelii 17X]|uniref:Fam-b protein n=3 Tax=Plasmodium yoelii TaxID=5861 RepID=A0AAE9X099_PLAYO|nr:fam-b protein [Plasmodium yoelii]ETB56379.1 hypothetical protein YYC_05808 [Plasmodium yoelii 17X]WBY59672.1 fam-b protein [Plasmodium yoelii yoelii]CDU19653.1 fam-b protein [Plasmodium yoelii]VTZ80410.1 fam-b protein [Plasmodium yoelii]|eukprot:XP_022813472.1 fam-b protein [Plasmodium yoelii]
MRIGILKFVFFSIVICFFEYAKNELYFVNERDIYLERNINNFRNNRILADVDNQFNINDFYQSTLSLANQFNDYNDGDDDEEMIFLRNIIDSQIKKHKENNTLPDLNNVDKKTKKLINGLRTELEEIKKEFDNKRNDELAIQPIQDKIITKKDENNSVSEHENFRQLENYENNSVSEHESFRQLENYENNLESENYNFDSEYIDVTLSSNYKKLKIKEKIKRERKKILKKGLVYSAISVVIFISGWKFMALIILPCMVSLFKKYWKGFNLLAKFQKKSK